MATPDTAFIKQFSDTISMLVQQFDSRLSPFVMVDMGFRGEKKFYDQYASDDLVELTARYQDTPEQLPDHQRRAVTPRYFVGNTLEDPFDALRIGRDPKSAYMQAKLAACNRKKDDVIISAMGGSALVGKEGTSTQAFDATHQIAVTFGSGSTDSGMTKAKILRAKRLLDEDENEMEDRYAVASAAQFEDLLNTTEVASSDYNTVKALYNGEVNTWVGFDWKRSERLLTNASSHRLCYLWQKKAIQMAIQKDCEGRMDELPTKNYAWQVYIRICLGAVRLEEKRIVEIACNE